MLAVVLTLGCTSEPPPSSATPSPVPATAIPAAISPTPAAQIPAPTHTPTSPTPITGTPTLTPPAISPTPSVLDAPTVSFGDAVFTAELAITPDQRQQGLSGREGLPIGAGMLFIFETRSASSFWMKGMRFPLDFVWISDECRVVAVTENVPPPEPDATTLPTYRSEPPAAYNFEINAGEARARGVEVGDRAIFAGIPDHVGETCEIND